MMKLPIIMVISSIISPALFQFTVDLIIKPCKEGWELNGLLCYPLCKEGYYGVGPVCWQPCPSGYTDIGVGCQKPAAYGRGVGYVLWEKDDCENDHPQGCEKWGLIWYPKCQQGFHAFGCCICTPDCPNGMTDTGAHCTKNSYGRGAGESIGGGK